MPNLHTRNTHALRLLMTDDIYILTEKDKPFSAAISDENPPEELIQPTEEINKAKEFSYLGENNKYFLILFDDNSRNEISSLHKETLMKIMSAKGLELRDLAILNLAQYPEVNFIELKEFFSCSKIVLFGIDPQRLALPAISTNQSEKSREVKVLATFSIDEMISDTTKKREFWNVMKEF